MVKQALTYGLIASVLLLASPLSAQLNKANRLFDGGAYSQAARLYEKELSRDSTNHIAINNLAHCYRFEKNFSEARNLFQQTLSFITPESSNYYYYAEMHYLLGEYRAAIEVLDTYLVNNPGDPDAIQLLATINQVIDYPVRADFEIVVLRGINSPFADFAPVVHNAGLVFTTERKEDSGKEEFSIEEKPFTNIYYAPFSNKMETSFWTPKVFNPKLTTRFHDGPACFNEIGDVIYFTQVEREFMGSDQVNPMKIFRSRYIDEEWTKPNPVPFNNPGYSVGHPTLSRNDSTMIYTSDMPGGRGGMDLYMTRLIGGTWSEGVNLGPKVNTAGDEVFPHLQDGTLYFSSNGWPGFGGLDLFVTHIDSLDKAPRNLYKPINSGWDDLSISYLNENKAYFSSDRPGGMGRDDIYGLHRVADDSTHREISGILEYDEKPAPFAALLLKDRVGNILQKTVTNEQGQFSLDYLKSKVPYTLSLDVNQEERLERYAIFLLNQQNQKVQKITPSESGDFKFELLPPDDFDNLELLDVEDVSLLSIDIHGQVFKNDLGDFNERIEILILNSDGDVISRTFTRNNGRFIFKNLFPDDQYIFRLLAENPGLQIAILDDQGNVIERLSRSGSEFIYNRIGEGDPILSLINERNVTIKISPDDHFAIPNIYYDLDAFELNDAARKQLDKLVSIMQKNPQIGVNVMSHTDSRATDQYNLKLSEKRAEAVVEYLESEGIDGSRVSGKGFGEKKLVNDCTNNVDCTEEEHARNRRTEFSLNQL